MKDWEALYKMVKFCGQLINDEESVDFGKTCGTLLIPERKDGKSYLICRKCGYTVTVENSGDYTERTIIQHTEKEHTLIIEGAEDLSMPTIAIDCPKCSHTKAWFMQLQTRRADESMTIFYRCQKCYNTWKELD